MQSLKVIVAWLGIVAVIVPGVAPLMGLRPGVAGIIVQVIGAIIAGVAAWLHEAPDVLLMLDEKSKDILMKVAGVLSVFAGLAPSVVTLPAPWPQVVTTLGGLGAVLAAYLHISPGEKKLRRGRASSALPPLIALFFCCGLGTAEAAPPKAAMSMATMTSTASSFEVEFGVTLQLTAVHLDGSVAALNRVGFGLVKPLGPVSVCLYVAGAVANDSGTAVGMVGPQLLFGLPIPLGVGFGWDLLRIGGHDPGFDTSSRAYYFTLTGPVSVLLLEAFTK